MSVPKRMTPERKKKMIAAIGQGYSISGACQLIEVSRTVEWEERKADAIYAAELQAQLDRQVEMVEDVLYQKALSGDVQALRFWLINRSQGKWKSEYYVRVGGEKPGEPIRMDIREVIVELPVVQMAEDEDDA